MTIRKLTSVEQDAIEEIKLLMGDGLIDIDLDNKHFVAALDYAFKIYRQRAENATETVGVAFNAKKDTQVYDLSDSDIVDVTHIYRHNIGMPTQTDHELDPFVMLYTSSLMGAINQRSTYGSVATIHMQYQHIEMVRRLLANDLQFSFNKSRKELTIMKYLRRDETLLVMAERMRPNEDLLLDPDTQPWITSYAQAKAKYILGSAYSLFGTIPSPNGGITIDGSQWKQEAQEEMEHLEEQLIRLTTSTRGMPFTSG